MEQINLFGNQETIQKITGVRYIVVVDDKSKVVWGIGTGREKALGDAVQAFNECKNTDGHLIEDRGDLLEAIRSGSLKVLPSSSRMYKMVRDYGGDPFMLGFEFVIDRDIVKDPAELKTTSQQTGG